MNRRIDNWLWLCPAMAVALAAAVLWWWGFTWPGALLAALALVCPVLLLWGAWHSRRSRISFTGDAPRTTGMTMNWAAPIYDGYCPMLGLGTAFRRETLHHAQLRPGERVLEVGCGTGVLTRLAAEAVGPTGAAIGIDAAPVMIAVARAKATRHGSRATFELAAIETLPFADGSFDVVLASLMLHHLPPAAKDAGLASVRRVLKPAGRLVIVDVDRPANRLWWLLLWPLLALPMTAGNLRGHIPAYVERSGFEAIRVAGHWMGLLTFWVAGSGAVAGDGGRGDAGRSA